MGETKYKKEYMDKKKIKLLWVSIIAIGILMVTKIFTNWTILMIIGVILLVPWVVLQFRWLRCPYCGYWDNLDHRTRSMKKGSHICEKCEKKIYFH